MAFKHKTKTRNINGTTYIALPRRIVNDSQFDNELLKQELEVEYELQTSTLQIRKVKQIDRERNATPTGGNSHDKQD